MPEDPDEFYDHQLVGLAVVDTPTARAVGEVTEVVHLPGQDLLVGPPAGRREVLVPFVAGDRPEVDLAGGAARHRPAGRPARPRP